MATGVKHVIFDADGVLQEIPGGWYGAMESFLGSRAVEFLQHTWQREAPTLIGLGDYRPMLAEDLLAFDVTATVEEVLAGVWFAIDVDQRSMDLVRSVRDAGFGVHLGTNQGTLRADHMRRALGYDEQFDTCLYSCDLGHAKPDVEFFLEALRRIDAAPEEVAFIDDIEVNVEGARAAGLIGIQWHLDDGHPRLVDALGAHGIHI